MSRTKLAVIYYSATGTNHAMARAVAESAEKAGAEVRLRRVRELAPDEAVASNPAWKAHVEATRDLPEATLDDLEWADALVVGTPTRFGNVAAQVKQFLDSTGPLWAKGALANKVVAGFTSAQNAHGGQETTLLALYNTFYHWGAFIVPPGYTDKAYFAAGGNPYGVSTSATGSGPSEEALVAARVMARRVVEVAGWIAKGRAA